MEICSKKCDFLSGQCSSNRSIGEVIRHRRIRRQHYQRAPLQLLHRRSNRVHHRIVQPFPKQFLNMIRKNQKRKEGREKDREILRSFIPSLEKDPDPDGTETYKNYQQSYTKR